MRRRSAVLVLLAVAVAIALVARACGGGGPEAPPADVAADTTGAARRPDVPPRPRAGRPSDSAEAPPPTATVVAPDGPVALEVTGVLRSTDGAPLAGARVSLLAFRGTPDDDRPKPIGDETSVVTGEDGRFAFRGVPSSSVRLRAVADDHVTAWFRGTVHGDGTTLELRVRRGGTLRAWVVDGEGRPVAGATVGLFPMPHVTFAGHFKTWLRCDRTTTTGADGACVVTGIDTRRFRIAATADGRGLAAEECASGDAEVRLVLDGTDRGGHRWVYDGLTPAPPRPEVPPDSREPADVPPPDPGTPAAKDETAEPDPPAAPEPARAVTEVVATVVTADGVPVRGAYVNVRSVEDRDREIGTSEGSAAPGREGYRRTDEDGTARIEIRPGTWDVDAAPDEFDDDPPTARSTFQVAAGESRRLELRLADVFAVPVAVRTVSGRPTGSVRLDVRSGGDSHRTQTARDGTTRVLAVRGRDLRIEAFPEGLPAASAGPVAVPTEHPVAITVVDVATIRGRVLDPASAPLFGVAVEVRPEGAAPESDCTWSAWTDDRGAFAVVGPPAGTFDVAADAFAYRVTVVHGVHAPDGGEVVIRLAERPLLRGRVTGPDGAPLAGAWIVCEDGRGGSLSSAADGTFVLAHRLAADEVSLEVGHEGCAPRTVRATVGLPCNVRLEREGGEK